MKKILCLFSLLAMLAIPGQAMAYFVTLSAAPQTIDLGGATTVNLDLTVGPAELLDGFNLSLAFNNTILGFDSFASTTIGDTNFDYLSGLSDNGDSIGVSGYFLGGVQLTNNTFTLASLSFIGNAYGTSPLNLTGTVLDANSGSEFALSAARGTVDVFAPPPPVPEPGTFVLLGLGLAGLVGFRSKFRKA